MKTGLLLLLFFFSLTTLAQGDRLAAFPGGDAAFNRYIQSHLFTTPEANKAGVKGEIIYRFTINEKGRAESFTAYQKLNYGLEEQVEKLLQEMPDWEPGIINGRTIKTSFTKKFLFTDSTPVGSGVQLALKKQIEAPASDNSEQPAATKVKNVPPPPPVIKKADAAANILSHLKQGFSYPKELDKKWEGSLYVQLYLQPNGGLNNIVLVKGADELVDRQVIALLKTVPVFLAGTESLQPSWKVYDAEILISNQKIRAVILRP
jgi:Gram-negative bacterial TonB protein C-terminal